jgi:hypothetical protein
MIKYVTKALWRRKRRKAIGAAIDAVVLSATHVVVHEMLSRKQEDRKRAKKKQA